VQRVEVGLVQVARSSGKEIGVAQDRALDVVEARFVVSAWLA